jgi:hypothetical protein
MCWMLDDSAFESTNDSTSVPIGKLRKCLSLAKCIVSVSKNKFTSFHLGFALQIFWFFVCSTFHRFRTQKSCGYTWELYLVVMMVGDISQFTICIARFLISHVRFYAPFTLLLDVTLPLLFMPPRQRVGGILIYPCPSVRPSVRPSGYRYMVCPPTVLELQP